MELAAQGRELIAQIDNAAQQFQSIAGLKRLGPHAEVKEFWREADLIMSRVDWQAQSDTLADINRLTLKYEALEFADFYSSVPGIVDLALKAKQHANNAANSLGKAAIKFSELSNAVDKFSSSSLKPSITSTGRRLMQKKHMTMS